MHGDIRRGATVILWENAVGAETFPQHAEEALDHPIGRVLVIVAAPKEREAVLDGLGIGLGTGETGGPWAVWEGPGVVVVESGVGKANAAGAAAWALGSGDAERPFSAVVSVGIAGTLSDRVGLGELVLGTQSVFADEGLLGPEGFTTMSGVGFPLVPQSVPQPVPQPVPQSVPGSGSPSPSGMGREGGASVARSGSDGVVADPAWLARIAERLGDSAHRGAIATVSTCSGTDRGAAEVAARTGAIAEAMEGAAVGLVAARFGVAFVELRAISNTTGERPTQRWDLAGGLRGVRDAVARAF